MKGRALVIIDVQNDFVEGGALGVPHGLEVISEINEIRESNGPWDLVVATQDWHPVNHTSFACMHHTEPFTQATLTSKSSQKTFETTLWPVHCVAGTRGAEFVPGLALQDVKTIKKGSVADTECYSAFNDVFGEHDTGLNRLLQDHKIGEVVLVGLALDFCVMYTALDSVHLGYETIVQLRGTRAISEEGHRQALERLRSEGVELR